MVVVDNSIFARHTPPAGSCAEHIPATDMSLSPVLAENMRSPCTV